MAVLAAVAALALPITPAPDTPADATWPVPAFDPVIVVARYRGLSAREWRARYVRERVRARALRRTLLHRGSVTEAIALAATAYGQSFSSMRRRAVCESGLAAGARNSSTASGLFQLLYPSTWRTTPYRGFSPYSPYANAMAAGYMLSRGRAGEWVCGG